MGEGIDKVARQLAEPASIGRRSILGRVALLFAGVGAGVVAAETPSFAATAGTCPPGLKLCGTRCRVISIDPDNCGACGTRCASNQVCRAGKCKTLTADPTCPGGQTWCGACVNTQTSSQHCGACGVSCAAGKTCSNGVCVTAPECASASDCGVDSECATFTCNQGVCGASFTAAGTPVAVQVAGDCQVNVCDGNGATVSQNDDSDPPDAGECMIGTCSGGNPTLQPVTTGTPCSGGVCDGTGLCVA